MPANFLRIFRQHIARDVIHHPLLAALNIASIALGVAVYFAIQISNQSANRAFAATIDLVAGKAQLQITAPAADLPETVLPEIQHARGVTAATPIVRGIVTLPDLPGEYLQLLGIDIFTNQSFRTFQVTDFNDRSFDVEQWLAAPNVIAVTDEFARAHGLHRGAALRCAVNGTNQYLHIGFIMRPEGAAALDSHFAAIDIGWAQELFGLRGVLGGIQLRLTDTDARARDRTAAELRKKMPSTALVAAPAQRGSQVEHMLGSFQLNLTAMSLVSLLVGVFLIYNTVAGSVARRLREIGILRALGVTRNEVRALFLGEALLFAVPGILLGLVGGVLLARGLIGPVSRTISSLYVLIHVRDIAVTPMMALAAALAGLSSVVLGGWIPSDNAARIPPAHALHTGSFIEKSVRPWAGWFALGCGALVLACAFSGFALRTGPPWLGFGAAFCVLSGFSLFVPTATMLFAGWMSWVLQTLFSASRRRWLEAGLALSNLRRSLSRNSVTIAALAAAVAMGVGVSVMVFSFRQTVASWIAQTLTADLFVAPASNEIAGPSSFMPPATVAFLAKHPAVGSIDTFREIDLPFRNRTIAVAVIRGNARRQLQFLRGTDADVMDRFQRQQCVIVSETFARRYDVHAGGAVELPTPAGLQSFTVAGVFYDYTRDQGIVYLSTTNFARFWRDERVHSVAVFLKPNAPAEELIAAFRQQFSLAGEFAIYRNRDLRERVFQIFDQTFAVTYVLRSIAVIVAVVGIFLTLTTLVTERSRELAILRAIGGSRRQVLKLLLWEAIFIGLLASMVGIISGLCLSTVLTGVINRAFFGWTIQLAFPWSSLAWTPLWITSAAFAAGLVPAWRATKLDLATALRSE
ncbi:MAG: FtsX-like permease family protein [Chthoniobacterales bacterium]